MSLECEEADGGMAGRLPSAYVWPYGATGSGWYLRRDDHRRLLGGSPQGWTGPSREQHGAPPMQHPGPGTRWIQGALGRSGLPSGSPPSGPFHSHPLPHVHCLGTAQGRISDHETRTPAPLTSAQLRAASPVSGCASCESRPPVVHKNPCTGWVKSFELDQEGLR